jgi:hypothetical protein
MRVWLGVLGRACIEFLIILLLVSAAATAGLVELPSLPNFHTITLKAVESALELLPLAALLTIFLSFFSFETRMRSRSAGWLGLLVLGTLLFAVGIGMRRVPLLQEISSRQIGGASSSIQLILPGRAIQKDRAALWIGAYEKGEAIDAVGVDFGSDYPRLDYAPRAEVDPASGELDVQGRNYSAAASPPSYQPLAPELSMFSGSWIWDRLAAADREPLYVAFAMAGGFLLLALGLRFICRLTSWPLANALLAAAALAGLAILDAILSGPAVIERLEALASRLGLHLGGAFILAGLEALLGLTLSAVDLATAPRSPRRIDE